MSEYCARYNVVLSKASRVHSGSDSSMDSSWLKRSVRLRVLGAAFGISLICGVLVGWYSGYVAQAAVLQVSFLGNPSPTESWSCAVHLNNEGSFRIVNRTGNGEVTFYYVNNILATCSKQSPSIYSIGVSFRALTGQALTGVSTNPKITTNSWSRAP